MWNLADCLDRVAAIRGDAEALVQGPRRISWRDVERRAGNLAAWMLEHGATHQGKVAIYTYNHPGLHGGRVRRVQGRAGAGERQLPLPRGGAALPARQRRRRDRRRARGLRDAARHGDRRRCRRSRGVLVVTRVDAAPALPRLREPTTRPSPRPTRPAPTVRAQRRRHDVPLHRRHHRHAERA